MWLVGHISPSPPRANQPEILPLVLIIYTVWWHKEPHNVFYMWSRSYSGTPHHSNLDAQLSDKDDEVLKSDVKKVSTIKTLFPLFFGEIFADKHQLLTWDTASESKGWGSGIGKRGMWCCSGNHADSMKMSTPDNIPMTCYHEVQPRTHMVGSQHWGQATCTRSFLTITMITIITT